MQCPECGSNHVIKKGRRQLKRSSEQVYYCNNCGKKFVNRPLKNKSYPARVIITSLKLYNSGNTLSETSKKINQRFKVNTTKSTVHNWIKEYDRKGYTGYSKHRDQYKKKYGTDLIKERTFHHSDLEYLFKFHKAKLKETENNFPELVEFIQNIEKNCPDKLFNQEEKESNRSSQLDLKVNKDLDIYETQNKACELAEFALKGNKNRRERHEDVQDFMLKCDNATLAVEVPIWWYDKKEETSITGHIDLIQERANKIFILDYKPKAEKKTPFGQLYSYARGLSYRTGIPPRKIKTAWFNQNVYKEFSPLKVTHQ